MSMTDEEIELIKLLRNDPSMNAMVSRYENKWRDYLHSSVPWYTTSAIKYLESLVFIDDRVLEYGGGSSTIWWACRVKTLHVIEAMPQWIIWLTNYLCLRPDLMKRVRLFFCPTLWNTDARLDPKPYWEKHGHLLNDSDIDTLELDYIFPFKERFDIVVFDGALRDKVAASAFLLGLFSRTKIIVVDNTESRHTFLGFNMMIDENNYVRLDFPRSNYDVNEIPEHQNGKHITSIYVLKEFYESLPLNGKTLDDNEILKYQNAPAESDGVSLQKWENTIKYVENLIQKYL